MQELKNQLAPIAAQVAQYPFLEVLDQVVEKLKSFSNKPYTWFLTELPRMGEELLNLKEDTIDPVRKFMSGPQKGIFDSARRFIQTQEPNFAYIENEQASQINLIVTAKDCYKGNKMQQLKTVTDALQQQIKEKLASEIEKAAQEVTELKDRLCGMSEFAALKPDQQKEITAPFDAFCRTIAANKLIAVIRDNLRRFEENDYKKLLTSMAQMAQPAPEPPPLPVKPDKSRTAGKNGKDDKNVREPEPEPAPAPAPKPLPVEYVNSRSISVPFGKAWLADKSDVDSYVESMRQAMLAEIEKGKRIQI